MLMDQLDDECDQLAGQDANNEEYGVSLLLFVFVETDGELCLLVGLW